MSYKRSYYLFLSLIIIGGIAFGYNISIIASALPKIRLQFNISEQIISLIAGLVFLGMVCAKLLMAFLNDNYGRRRTLIIASIVFIFGTLCIITAQSVSYIIIGRILQGFGGGLLMFTTSLYIVEVSNDKNRGSLTGLYQLSFTIGLLVANLIGMIVYDISWKISFEIILIMVIVFMFIIYYLPCSPKWLYLNGYELKSKEALLINHDINEIDNVILSWGINEFSVRDKLLQRRYVKPLFLVIVVTCLHQLTGINAILQTSTVLISEAGLSQYAALLGSVGITAINIIATLVGLALIDKFPRNLMLGVCAIVIALAHFIVSLNFFLNINSSFVLLGGLAIFITAYAIGPGIIIWLVFSEYLPTAVRGRAIAIAGFINSLAGFLISSSFLHLSALYGIKWVFFLCGIFSLFYAVIPILYLPDTNGKNIEDVDKLFKK